MNKLLPLFVLFLSGCQGYEVGDCLRLGTETDPWERSSCFEKQVVEVGRYSYRARARECGDGFEYDSSIRFDVGPFIYERIECPAWTKRKPGGS